MEGNLYALFQSRFPVDRAAVCLEVVPDGRTYTWEDVDRTVARLANFLSSLGLPPGARVVAQTEKSPEALFLYLAALRAGLVFVPLNTAYRESEAGYFLGNAEPDVVVCRPSALAAIEALAARTCGARVWTLADDGTGGTLLEDAAGQPDTFDTVPRSPDALALLIYTSGTTGRSKGAMLSHGNLAANALALHEFWGWRADDAILHALPIFHVHGLCVAAHGALLSGGARTVWMAKFDPAQAVRQLPRSTLFMGVPTLYTRLLAQADFGADTCANVRLFVSGSAPLAPATFREFQARTGHTLLERYGMSETVMLSSNPYRSTDGPRLAGTVGRPLPGVAIRVVDDAGTLCPPDVVGRIEVRGPNVCDGYWRAPEKTREDWTPDGWFKTGDVGRFGGEGVPADYLSIVGRSKDLVITGGYNVYPKEVEGFLDAVPGVLESAVFGVPDPDFGEAVAAAVVLRSGEPAPQPAEIIAALRSRIAGFKVPKRVHLLPELPRNAMGKVEKKALRETFGANPAP